MEINGNKTDPRNLQSNYAGTQKENHKPPLNSSWVAALFAKLHARYGHKWVSAYPPGPVLNLALNEWADGLSGFTGEDIKRGFSSWNEDWPPSLPEFKKACKPPTQKALHKRFPSLPKPPADKTIGRKCLDMMKAITGRR